MLVMTIFLLSQFSGILAMRPYTIQIMAAYGTPLDANWATVVIGLVGLLGNLILLCIIRLTGKRRIYLIALAVTFISCFILGGYIFNDWIEREILRYVSFANIYFNSCLWFHSSTHWLDVVRETWIDECRRHEKLHSTFYFYFVEFRYESRSGFVTLDAPQRSIPIQVRDCLAKWC